MKKTFIFMVLTIFWIVLLFPKDVLWNNFVKDMQEKDTIIIAQKKEDLRYKFTAQGIKVYFKNFKVADISKVEAKLWLFFNKISLKNSRLSQKMPILKNLKIVNSNITYTVLAPTKIKIQGTSNQGDFVGVVEIFKHKGFILLKNSTVKDVFLQQYFKKTKEGMKYEFAY